MAQHPVQHWLALALMTFLPTTALVGCSSAPAAHSASSAVTASSTSSSSITRSTASSAPPLIPTRTVLAQSLATLIAREHRGRSARDTVCATYVATSLEISRLQYHGASVSQVDPALEHSNDLECIYARHIGAATSLFRVYVRRAASSDQPPGYTGQYAVTSRGLRLMIVADDTGDTDVSLGIGGDVARNFMITISKRIRA